MMTQWPSEVKERFDGSNKYMKALLECSPYPLCLFNFNGQLITCNPAAKAVFGDTIWLQSDIFGMSERERRGLQARNSTGLQRERSGLEPAEHTERCSAYEAMMEELVEDGSSYQTDLLIRRQSTTTGPEEFWYTTCSGALPRLPSTRASALPRLAAKAQCLVLVVLTRLCAGTAASSRSATRTPLPASP